MQALPQGVPVFCSVKLSDNDRRTGRKAGEDADNQIDDLRGRAPTLAKASLPTKCPTMIVSIVL